MNETYKVDMAQSASSLKLTNGPTTLLPENENNQLVTRWDLGFQYGMWISGKGPTKTVLNCTRLNISNRIPKTTTQTMREEFLGYSFKANNATTGRVPCSLSSSSSSSSIHVTEDKACDEWIWVNEFGCGTAGGKPVMGREPEVWRTNTSLSSGVILASMTNTILKPTSCPGPASISASIDYTENWAADPDSTLFDVPSDSDCPLTNDIEMFRSNIHSSLLLLREGISNKF
jgi:hypothetical protein